MWVGKKKKQKTFATQIMNHAPDKKTHGLLWGKNNNVLADTPRSQIKRAKLYDRADRLRALLVGMLQVINSGCAPEWQQVQTRQKQ